MYDVFCVCVFIKCILFCPIWSWAASQEQSCSGQRIHGHWVLALSLVDHICNQEFHVLISQNASLQFYLWQSSLFLWILCWMDQMPISAHMSALGKFRWHRKQYICVWGCLPTPWNYVFKVLLLIDLVQVLHQSLQAFVVGQVDVEAPITAGTCNDDMLAITRWQWKAVFRLNGNQYKVTVRW